MYSSSQKLNRKTILLLGTGRSGTTWLSGLLASPFRYRLLFEPFHPDHISGGNMIADHYFDPNDIPEYVVDFCDQAFNDKINSDWIAQSSNRRFNMHRWRFWPKVRICKEIRCNLLIPALRSIYGNELPIIVLIRNPIKVIESFMRVKFPWAFEIDTLVSQNELGMKYNLKLDHLKKYSNSDVGKLAIRWAIENAYILNRYKELNINLVYYEDIHNDPVTKIAELCKQLDINIPDKLDQKVGQLSFTTHPRSPLRQADPKRISPQLSSEELLIVNDILEIINVEYPYF